MQLEQHTEDIGGNRPLEAGGGKLTQTSVCKAERMTSIKSNSKDCAELQEQQWVLHTHEWPSLQLVEWNDHRWTCLFGPRGAHTPRGGWGCHS